MKPRYPDFFIVGAPKAGTTSIYDYLGQHPDVYLPANKEPVYLSGYKTGFTGPGAVYLNRNIVPSEDEYLALFSKATADMLVGEASTDYLASEEAAANIKKRNPLAKIIIILRNPIERAYSEHMHLVRDQFENQGFMDSLLLEQERIEKGYVPLFWHIKRGMYYPAVKRYFDAFSANQIKVILYEELCADVDKVMSEVSYFLGLKKHNFSTELKSNVSGIAKNSFLQKIFVYYRSSHENSLIKRVARLGSNKILRKKLMRLYLNKNIKKEKGVSVDEKLYLKNIFREDIQKLQSFLKIDLDWV